MWSDRIEDHIVLMRYIFIFPAVNGICIRLFVPHGSLNGKHGDILFPYAHVAHRGADGPIRGGWFDFQPHGAISLCSKETLFSITFDEQISSPPLPQANLNDGWVIAPNLTPQHRR